MIMYFVIIFTSLCILTNAEDAVSFPGGFKQCEIQDSGCLSDAINYAIQTHSSSGIKELGLVPLDPLYIKRLHFAKQENSPVSIDMSFANASLIGLRGSKVKVIQGLQQDLNEPLQFELYVKKIILKGPYTIEGKILILPIQGEGDSEITLVKARFLGKLTFKHVKRDGLTFAQVLRVELDMIPGGANYRLGGLFNGQKELSDNMHQLINENWKEIFDELKPGISVSLGAVFRSIFNNVFNKTPLEHLFLNY